MLGIKIFLCCAIVLHVAVLVHAIKTMAESEYPYSITTSSRWSDGAGALIIVGVLLWMVWLLSKCW